MTKREAKALGIEIWEYLIKHPRIECLHSLPNRLLKKIKDFPFLSPVCAATKNCAACPLGKCGELYVAYLRTKTNKARRAAAQEIVDKIKAWEVEE